MVREARAIIDRYGSTGNVVVKIPVNPATSPDEQNQYDGLKAIYTLAREEITVNTTLVMTPEQALLAARAGATYVSPFAGRIDDLLSERNKEENRKNQIITPMTVKTHQTDNNCTTMELPVG